MAKPTKREYRSSALPEEHHAAVRALRAEGVPIAEIAERYGVSGFTIQYGVLPRSPEERAAWHGAARSRAIRSINAKKAAYAVASGYIIAAGTRCPTRVLADTQEEAEAFLASLGGANAVPPAEIDAYLAGEARGSLLCAVYGVTPARLFVLVSEAIAKRERDRKRHARAAARAAE